MGINCRNSFITSNANAEIQNTLNIYVLVRSMYFDNNQKHPIGNKKDPNKFGAIPKIYLIG
jgi:hypothetical protein